MKSQRRSILGTLVGLLLLPATLSAQETQQAQAQDQPRQIEVTILGMSCPFCAYGVEQKLKRVEGVKGLEVELESGLATVTLEEGADISNEKLIETIDDAGFEVAKIVRNFESAYPDFERKAKS